MSVLIFSHEFADLDEIYDVTANVNPSKKFTVETANNPMPKGNPGPLLSGVSDGDVAYPETLLLNRVLPAGTKLYMKPTAVGQNLPPVLNSAGTAYIDPSTSNRNVRFLIVEIDPEFPDNSVGGTYSVTIDKTA